MYIALLLTILVTLIFFRLDNNLEQRTEEVMNLSKLYTFFTDVCQGDGTADIVDQIKFNQVQLQ